MDGLFIAATLYIVVGGTGFLLNILATISHLITHRPLMPLTIYGLSDTLSGVLSGTGLLCDGCLYIADLTYRHSCSRYFLMYVLLLLPIITSNFSTLGNAVEHYWAMVGAHSEPGHRRCTFPTVWCLVSWFTVVGSVLVVWGHTSVDSVDARLNDGSYWHNNAIRINRGLLQDLWEYNSQQDWSTDYRESVIIGLVYGITAGNISHRDLLRFYGAETDEQTANLKLQVVKELHTALGITDKDQRRVFGELLVQQTQKITNIGSINHDISSSNGAGHNYSSTEEEDTTITPITSTETKTDLPSNSTNLENSSVFLQNDSSPPASNFLQTTLTPPSNPDTRQANVWPLKQDKVISLLPVLVGDGTEGQTEKIMGVKTSTPTYATEDTTQEFDTTTNPHTADDQEQYIADTLELIRSIIQEMPIEPTKMNTSGSITHTGEHNVILNPDEEEIQTAMSSPTHPIATTCQVQVSV